MNDKYWTETISGKRFDLKSPNAKDVDINDIACGIAKTARFNGQTKGFLSVALHVLNTEDWLREQGESYRIRLAGLMHDASEAYIHDVSSPLKTLLINYRAIERRVTQAILKGLDLEEVLCLTKDEQKRVKKADQVMLITERRDFKAKTNRRYHKSHCAEVQPWKRKLRSMGWRQAERLFLEQYHYLRGKI
jgi:5'-deoxynucleotidase YfbR-like HD superfamily hydrolase